MLEKSLLKLGFSPSEIKVYLNLLNTGSSYPHKISSEIKINRSNIYEALDRLISKGVVSFVVKNKVKWFEAKPAKYILTLLEAKEQELKQNKTELLTAINHFTPLSASSPLEATIFTGKKGLRMLFDEMLDARKPIHLIAAQLQFQEIFGPYFELWHKIRIERNIPQKSIFPINFKSKLKKRELLEYHFINDKFTNPTTTILFGNICLLIQWSKEPLAIRINNPEIVKSHFNYFNQLWETSQK